MASLGRPQVGNIQGYSVKSSLRDLGYIINGEKYE